MGKKNKKSKTSSNKASSGSEESGKKMESKKEEEKEERVITMKALQEMSDSDSDGGELPPEEEWDADAKALRDAIEGGVFEKLLKKSNNEKDDNADDDDDDDESFEEVVLDDDDDNNEKEDSPKAKKSSNEKQENHENDDGESSSSESEEEEDEEKADDVKEHADDESENNDDDGSDDENDDKEEDEEDEEKTFSPFNKGLAVVTQELQAAKRHLPWVETFDIVPKTPLPFEAGTTTALDIHDDLKREVAFYDMALEAVQEAKIKCEAAKVPFTRPEDFFAEMVKTDDQMARIKDRLLFETKKMDAVAQRKSNKEQKLRAKEAHANKLVEKAKRKKDHFKAVEDWAASAESKRGKNNRAAAAGVDDEAFLRNMNRSGGESSSNNNGKKRMRADKKFGFGGKRGRFKKTDPSSLNDSTSFNRKGNFAQGMKKSPGSGGGAGGKRPGKRARDATRARRN